MQSEPLMLANVFYVVARQPVGRRTQFCTVHWLACFWGQNRNALSLWCSSICVKKNTCALFNSCRTQRHEQCINTALFSDITTELYLPIFNNTISIANGCTQTDIQMYELPAEYFSWIIKPDHEIPVYFFGWKVLLIESSNAHLFSLQLIYGLGLWLTLNWNKNTLDIGTIWTHAGTPTPFFGVPVM